MSRLGFLLIAAATAWSGPAQGVYWTLGASVSETLELNSNPDLDFDNQRDSGDIEFGTTTFANLQFGARTDRTVWSLSTGANLRYFTGQDDSNNNDNVNGLRPNLSGRMLYQGQTYSVSSRANFDISSTAFDEFRLVPIDGEEEPPPEFPTDPTDQLVRVTRDTDRISFGAGTTLSLTLSPVNSITTSLSYSGQRYSESVPGFSISDNIGGSFSFSHRLSQISSTGFSISVLRFTSEANQSRNNQDGFSVNATVDYSTELSPQTNISASLGAAYTDETDETDVNGVLVSDTDRTVSATGRLSLGVDLPRSRFRFGLSNGVRPSSTGDTKNVTSITAGYSHELTRHARLSISGQYSLQTPIGSTDEMDHFFSVGPALSYQLSQNWRASLAYRFRGSDEEEGTAIGNSVSLTLSRSFDLLH